MIVDDETVGSVRRSGSLVRTGNVNWNTVPPPGLGRAKACRRGPRRWRGRWRGRCRAPFPWSCRTARISSSSSGWRCPDRGRRRESECRPSADAVASRRNTLPRPASAAIASIALCARFRMTCWIWISSPSPRGRSGATAVSTRISFIRPSISTSFSASVEQLRHVDFDLLRVAAPHHRAQAIEHLARERRLAADLFQQLVELCAVDGAVARQPPATRQRVVLDGHQRLVDFVGHGGGHRADGVDAREVRQALAELRPSPRSPAARSRSASRWASALDQHLPEQPAAAAPCSSGQMRSSRTHESDSAPTTVSLARNGTASNDLIPALPNAAMSTPAAGGRSAIAATLTTLPATISPRIHGTSAIPSCWRRRGDISVTHWCVATISPGPARGPTARCDRPRATSRLRAARRSLWHRGRLRASRPAMPTGRRAGVRIRAAGRCGPGCACGRGRSRKRRQAAACGGRGRPARIARASACRSQHGHQLTRHHDRNRDMRPLADTRIRCRVDRRLGRELVGARERDRQTGVHPRERPWEGA